MRTGPLQVVITFKTLLLAVALFLGLPTTCSRERRAPRTPCRTRSIAGTTQGLTAYLLGSSYTLALGLIAGFLDIIPNIGATIAGFIPSLTLLAEEGLTAALIMLAVVLIYQQVENSILTPTIQGKAVKLSAFFIIVSVALFGALLGVIGALSPFPSQRRSRSSSSRSRRPTASRSPSARSGPGLWCRTMARPDTGPAPAPYARRMSLLQELLGD